MLVCIKVLYKNTNRDILNAQKRQKRIQKSAMINQEK